MPNHPVHRRRDPFVDTVDGRPYNRQSGVRPVAAALRLGPLGRLPADRQTTLQVAIPRLEVGTESAEFKGPVEVDVQITRIEGGARVTGIARVAADLRCGRCLDPFETELVGELEVRYRVDRRGDEDAFPYAEDVDLSRPIEEALVLAFPVVPLCSEDCPGLCPTCGRRRDDPACTCAPPEDPRWDGLRQVAALYRTEGET